MPKYLILTADPSVRWELPDDDDIEVTRELVYGAIADGAKAAHEGDVLNIPVVVDGAPANLWLRSRDIGMAAVVEVPELQPFMA